MSCQRRSSDGVLTWITESVTGLLGWSPEQLEGTPLRSLLHPEDQSLYDTQREAKRRGEDLRYEVRMRANDGSWRWVSVQSRGILDDRGTPSHRVAGWRDVTAEHEAREAVAESEAIMLAGVEGMLEPHVLCAAVRNEAGRIVDFTYLMANWAARKHLEAVDHELRRSSMLATLPALGPSGLLDAYAAVVETGQPFVEDAFWFRNDRLVVRPTTTCVPTQSSATGSAWHGVMSRSAMPARSDWWSPRSVFVRRSTRCWTRTWSSRLSGTTPVGSSTSCSSTPMLLRRRSTA